MTKGKWLKRIADVDLNELGYAAARYFEGRRGTFVRFWRNLKSVVEVELDSAWIDGKTLPAEEGLLAFSRMVPCLKKWASTSRT